MANLTRWNPIRDMMDLQSTMDRLFEETWRAGARGWSADLALDIDENDNAYTVVTSLPGVHPENIDITFHEGVLTISGETQQQERAEGTRNLIQERAYGKFSRSVRLPQPVNGDHIETNLDNGVLTVTLPKSEEAQPRRIPVNTNTVRSNGS